MENNNNNNQQKGLPPLQLNAAAEFRPMPLHRPNFNPPQSIDMASRRPDQCRFGRSVVANMTSLLPILQLACDGGFRLKIQLDGGQINANLAGRWPNQLKFGWPMDADVTSLPTILQSAYGDGFKLKIR
jgi:hypothetical protein